MFGAIKQWVVRGSGVRVAALVCGLVALAGAGGCDPMDSDGGDATLSQLDVKVPREFVPRRARGCPVKLKAPPGWRETSTAGAVVLNLQTGRPGSSLNLVVVPTSPGETLDKVVADLPEQLRHEFADFRLVKKDYLIINDLPAGRLVYEATRNGFHGKLMLVVLIKGGKDYVLTYTATPQNFDEEYPTVEQVAASLAIG